MGTVSKQVRRRHQRPRRRTGDLEHLSDVLPEVIATLEAEAMLAVLRCGRMRGRVRREQRRASWALDRLADLRERVGS